LHLLRDEDQHGSALKKNVKDKYFRNLLMVRLFQDFRLLIHLIKDYWEENFRGISAKSTVIFFVALVLSAI